MAYVKKTYQEGSLVTPEDMNRIEQGIKDNQDKINILRANTFMQSYCQQYYKGVYITDWNNVIENGLYMANSAANAPYENNWFEVQVIAHATGYITQVAYMFVEMPIRVFKRNCVNGVWQPWNFDSYTNSLPLNLQSGWSNVANTNSVVLVNAPIISIMGRIKGGSTTQYSNIGVFPFYIANGQFIVPLYNPYGSIVGSAIATGNELKLLSITDNSDVSFNFNMPISM